MTPHHLYILTGASRGMGLALAQQLLQPGHWLLTISRNAAQLSAPAGAQLLQWQHDLAQPQPAATQLQHWLQDRSAAAFASATLINNAALIPPIAPLSEVDGAALSAALRVGLEAPMLLTSAFLRACADWPCPKKVLNISSGLGRRPMASQATYCALKAGLDNFSQSLALEEARKPHGARVCSLAPGVIDTDMQRQMRSATAADFPDVARFVGLHAQGQLSSPQAAAQRVLACLHSADFGEPVLATVR